MSAEQENLRQTISDFIADPMCEADEAAWERHLQTYNELLAEVKDLQKKLDNLREYCHAEGYDIFNWEVKNIEVIE